MRGDLKMLIAVHRYLIVSAIFLLFAAPLQISVQPAKGRSSERSIRPILVNT